MKIIAVYSAGFERLRDEWFLATLPSDMQPVLVESPFDSIPGDGGWGRPQWRAALDFKLQLVCDTIRDHPGEVVCFSDVDVQFFGSFKSAILEAISGHDVAAMRESAAGGMNGGFYAIRCAPHVEALWEEAMFADKTEAVLHDQDALNALFDEGAHRVRRTLLPDSFWASHRHLVFKEPEPPGVLVNHVTSAPNKIAEMHRIRAKYVSV
ncbi:putative nucleotide-diphospho-sugar transferase [Verrucomicrobiota bacterium sgz303538]